MGRDVEKNRHSEHYGRVTNLLVALGFQARQMGYRYLRAAVCVAYKEPHMLTSVTKCLYPRVAKYYNTSDKRVERAIRNSIETAWIEGDPDVLNKFFGKIYDDGNVRPTNKQVIRRIVEFLEEHRWVRREDL